MKRLLKNAHLISPDRELDGVSVLIHDNKIERIFTCTEPEPEADCVFDVAGDFLMPGFVDIHCHGNSGCDVSDASGEGLETIAKTKLAEGVTTFLPTTLTLPEEALNHVFHNLCQFVEKNENYCKIPGVHLEGPYVNSEYLGAQNPQWVRPPDIREVRRLNQIFPIRKLTYALEWENSDLFASELLAEGIVPSCGHSGASLERFRAVHDEHGLRELTHFCNRMSPLHHREVGLLGAGFLFDDVSVELICDKLHLCPEMIGLIFSVKGIDRIQLVTDAMRAAWMPDGESSLGGLSVTVRNGEARLTSGGELAGSTLKMNQALCNVFEITGYPLGDLIKATSWNQACSLGLGKIGRIEPGYSADLAVLCGDFEVRTVFVEGEIRYSDGEYFPGIS